MPASKPRLFDAATAPETLQPLVEITLVWVLFSDAARVRVQDLRADVGRVVRLGGQPFEVVGVAPRAFKGILRGSGRPRVADVCDAPRVARQASLSTRASPGRPRACPAAADRVPL